MNEHRTETQKKLDEWLFSLQLTSKISAFGWLYLIGNSPIKIHHDTQSREILSTNSISHEQVIELVKTADNAEIIKHGVTNKFPLGLLLLWGNRSLAACNINPEQNRIILFIADL